VVGGSQRGARRATRKRCDANATGEPLTGDVSVPERFRLRVRLFSAPLTSYLSPTTQPVHDLLVDLRVASDQLMLNRLVSVLGLTMIFRSFTSLTFSDNFRIGLRV